MPLRVQDVMVTKVMTVGPAMRLTDVERMLLRERIGGLPVVHEGALVGLISRSDVLKHLQAVESQIAGALSAYDDGSESEADVEADRNHATAAVAADRAKALVEDAMTADVVSISPGASLADAARLMVDHRIHRLAVVEDGQLRGLLSTLDLAGLVATGRLIDA